MHVLPALVLAAIGALPTPVPVDAAQARAIDVIARGELHAHSTPGVAIGIVEDGLLIYAHGFGSADLRRKASVTPQTKFFTGAVSEQFSVASVLLLLQDKKLSLTDRVTRFLPELSSERDVTIGQLLAHTSGLPDLSDLAGIPHDVSHALKWDDVLRVLNRTKAYAPPGTVFRRNRLDSALAGIIVQRASGVPLSVFMQTRIFEPLIMTSTFLAGDQGAAGFARGYERAAGRFREARTPDPSWLFGSNDVISTVDDLAKWDIGLPLLLNVDSVRTMWSSVNAPGSALYGLGWVVDQRDGQTFVWRNGVLPGYHAMNAMLPEEHVAVIVLSNAGSPNAVSSVSPERLANRVLDIVAPVPQAHFANAIVRRAGEWLDRLERLDIDRTQLTPAFSQYLSDRVIIQADLHSEGPLESIVPVENFQRSGDTVYVFDVRFRHGSMRYQFALTPDGKIDALLLQPSS
ncbi:MAG: serine hydrolase domain-containing protein [Candidatus Baltobacteraceae bacterium]